MNHSKSWSINLGNLSGIPLRVHLSFFLFLLWVGFEEYINLGQPVSEVFFLIAIFGTILLHELGHALTALRFGVKTADITLYPFGGIATLKPLKNGLPARAELLIALAGPMVNFLLAGAVFLTLKYSPILEILGGRHFWIRFVYANAILGCFNLIPAYPMDGGRIFRSMLTYFLGHRKATRIAVRVAQVISIIFGLLALYYGQAMLAIVAAFVFMSAAQEDFFESTRATVSHLRVADVMIGRENLQIIRHGMTVKQALECALRSFQNFLPVFSANTLIGIASKEVLLQSQTLNPEESYVAEVMQREFPRVAAEDPLEKILESYNLGELPKNEPVLVFDGDEFQGMLYYPNLIEFLMLYGLPKPTRSDQIEF